MLKKIAIASCLLVTSLTCHASLISYNGYERDSDSQIVKGGGFEWLMWDVTKGQSIESALSIHKGWKLASSTQMASLFNAFQFGKSDWSDNTSVKQNSTILWTVDENSPHNQFMSLFGLTYDDWTCDFDWQSFCHTPSDKLSQVSAYFGNDSKGTSFSLATIVDDRHYRLINSGILESHDATLDRNMYEGSAVSFFGVALVRNPNVGAITVNLPSSISILVLGLAVLGLRRIKSIEKVSLPILG